MVLPFSSVNVERLKEGKSYRLFVVISMWHYYKSDVSSEVGHTC